MIKFNLYKILNIKGYLLQFDYLLTFNIFLFSSTINHTNLKVPIILSPYYYPFLYIIS